MKVLPLPLHAGLKGQVRSVNLAMTPQGLQLAAVVEIPNSNAVPPVYWLSVPGGDDVTPPMLHDPQATRGALPVVSNDLQAVAYSQNLPNGEHQIVLVRPFDSPPQFRGVTSEDRFNSFAFTPDGSKLYGVGDDVLAWHTGTFFTATISEDDGFEACFFGMSEGGADGSLSAVAGSGMYAITNNSGFVSTVYASDWSGGITERSGPITALAFTNNSGDRLAVAHGTKVGVYAMTYEDRDLDFDEVYCAVPLPDHPATVTGIALTPDGKILATCCADGLVRLWDAQTGAERQAYDWNVGELTAIAFSPDGLLGAVGTADSRVLIWDME